MKYDFHTTIIDRVYAKINGMDSRRWIQGTPAAAEACSFLAVRACVEMYIKCCVEHAMPHSRGQVTMLLEGMGFPECIIEQELTHGTYSAFFKKRSTPGWIEFDMPTRIMRVRITSCNNPSSWYANKVGQEFDVKPRMCLSGKGVMAYEVYPKPQQGPTKVIAKRDLEILSPI